MRPEIEIDRGVSFDTLILKYIFPTKYHDEYEALVYWLHKKAQDLWRKGNNDVRSYEVTIKHSFKGLYREIFKKEPTLRQSEMLEVMIRTLYTVRLPSFIDVGITVSLIASFIYYVGGRGRGDASWLRLTLGRPLVPQDEEFYSRVNAAREEDSDA